MSANAEETGTPASAPASWLGGWTVNAIKAGGILTVKRHGWNFRATMDWPLTDKEPIESEEGEPQKALADLEPLLNEDAADEMIKMGAA